MSATINVPIIQNISEFNRPNINAYVTIPQPPKVGMISVYDAWEEKFDHNGLVVLYDPISCYTEEYLNGLYVMELIYPIDERGKWQQLVEGNIIRNSDGQLFRIYRKVKTLQNIKVNALHLFYDLADNFIQDARPTSLNCNDALNLMFSEAQFWLPFTCWSEITLQRTQYFIRKNMVEALMAENFSVLKTWGGEIERDNYNIKIYYQRGTDNDVLISYGKNIMGLEETIDMSTLVTRIYPVGNNSLTLPEGYIDSPKILNYHHPVVRVADYPDIKTESELRDEAETYFDKTKADVPLVNYRIDFNELSRTKEYELYSQLETVAMGDTVTVRHSRLGVDIRLRVSYTKKNDITGKIEVIEIGDIKRTLSEAINEQSLAIATPYPESIVGGEYGDIAPGTISDYNIAPDSIGNDSINWNDPALASSIGNIVPGYTGPTIHTGTTDPASGLGSDGDVYIKY